MNSNDEILDVLSTTIDISKEPFLLRISDVTKVLCRMLIKNLDIFMRLFYYQSKSIFARSNKLTFYSLDAGDIYQSFRMQYPSAKNKLSQTILLDSDFARLSLTFTEEIKHFVTLNTFTEGIENPTELMWEVLKYMMIPVRINPVTIPVEERERILRFWLSTIFTLPLLDSYNEKHFHYQKAVSAIRSLYPALKLQEEKESSIPTFNVQKLNELASIPSEVVDYYVSPITPGKNRLDLIFRTYMYIAFHAMIDIIRKPCPNLSECKSINPDYQGDCIEMLDECVNAQIKKLQEVIKVLTPSTN